MNGILANVDTFNDFGANISQITDMIREEGLGCHEIEEDRVKDGNIFSIFLDKDKDSPGQYGVFIDGVYYMLAQEFVYPVYIKNTSELNRYPSNLVFPVRFSQENRLGLTVVDLIYIGDDVLYTPEGLRDGFNNWVTRRYIQQRMPKVTVPILLDLKGCYSEDIEVSSDNDTKIKITRLLEVSPEKFKGSEYGYISKPEYADDGGLGISAYLWRCTGNNVSFLGSYSVLDKTTEDAVSISEKTNEIIMSCDFKNTANYRDICVIIPGVGPIKHNTDDTEVEELLDKPDADNIEAPPMSSQPRSDKVRYALPLITEFGTKNSNGMTFLKDEYEKAINNERFQTMLKDRQLKLFDLGYGNLIRGNENAISGSVDLTSPFIIGTVLEVDLDKKLVIVETDMLNKLKIQSYVDLGYKVGIISYGKLDRRATVSDIKISGYEVINPLLNKHLAELSNKTDE